MTIDAIKPPKAVPEWIEDGIAVVTKTVRPTVQMQWLAHGQALQGGRILDHKGY